MSKEKKWAKVTAGEAIRGLREAHGMTQAQLAVRAGIHQQQVSRLENGVSGCSVPSAKKLARVLKVHPAVILFPDWTPGS